MGSEVSRLKLPSQTSAREGRSRHALTGSKRGERDQASGIRIEPSLLQLAEARISGGEIKHALGTRRHNLSCCEWAAFHRYNPQPYSHLSFFRTFRASLVLPTRIATGINRARLIAGTHTRTQICIRHGMEETDPPLMPKHGTIGEWYDVSNLCFVTRPTLLIEI